MIPVKRRVVVFWGLAMALLVLAGCERPLASDPLEAVDDQAVPETNVIAAQIGAETVTTITAHSPDPSMLGELVTIDYSVTDPTGAGTPTGIVTVSIGTVSCEGPVESGTCTLTPDAPGAQVMTATYVGDANFNTSSGTLTHTINNDAAVIKVETTTVITAHAPDPSKVGEALVVTFTVTSNTEGGGTPTGNVTIGDGAEGCSGTVESGSGTCTWTPTTEGVKTLTANYDGDAAFNGSVGSVSHTVNAADTTQPPSTTLPTDYTVKAGDRLFSIGRQFGVNAYSIAAANGILPPYIIHVGRVLTIPGGDGTTSAPTGGRTYIVRRGDNLFRIALRYGTTVQAIANANNIPNVRLIFSGQVLNIP